ncbi:uncharacterized protein LOC113661251 isoform X2 [Tachysurus fulvidraco]|uniref:uncharacterized protein LOC113661251 isoform X2 n=1 Tax=Tachysurus fulvidraco TaxID=1234273 RepID=UPI001FEDD84B|nr:uncharacterized protein LOC113661251 isoform X2 [Tachysurus fulvidraco]
MTTHKYTVIIIFSLFLPIEGEIFEQSVLEGKKFIFPLPNVTSDTDISSVEWKQRDRNKLLALISLDNANKTIIFCQESRFQFMQNGSMIIRDVKQEDTGNYTCKIIFKNNKIEIYIISLTLYSENTEQTPIHNSTSTTTVDQGLYIVLIPVTGGFLLLGSVIVILIKCRKKSSTLDEPIYMNSNRKCERNPQTKKKARCGQKEIK